MITTFLTTANIPRKQVADPLATAGAPHQGRTKARLRVPGLIPAVASSRPDGGENQDTDPPPVQQPRPAVARYRRQGDPNPRLRGHRQRQPIGETQDSTHGAEEREGRAEVQVKVQKHLAEDPVMDQSQDRESPHQTPVATVTPTHLSPAPATHNVQPDPQHTPPAEAEENLQDHKVPVVCGEEQEEVQEKNQKQEQAEDDGDCRSTTGNSGRSRGDVQTVDGAAEECSAERVEEDQEEVMDDVVEDMAAQGSEFTDLCSDTESAALLSMDGPLHSPPPLHSPTPPSSPDIPPFPQLDHFSEDASMSPVPDHDHDLPEDEDEDCSESCSLSHSTSCSESYPKTYADFYSESHQKSYPEPAYESYSEGKSYPNSFPEPLQTSYPELHREPCRRLSRRAERTEAQQESFTSHREESVQKVSPSSPTKGSHHAPRQVRGRGSRHSSLDRSVGCRLHHYDGQSDGEVDGGRQKSPISKSHRHPGPRRGETQDRSPVSSGHSSSGEAPEQRSAAGLPDEGDSRGSGDAITLAIKDIKEAIEEVKTKTMRSPYTPDQSVEPIWVMRQEVSPTEEVVFPPHTTAGHVSMIPLIIIKPEDSQ
uniref:Uncharacterized protein n=1 Tax=Scophthalmus maximus TaxID=52904 RepID=A0A8D3ASF4_SCOMX